MTSGKQQCLLLIFSEIVSCRCHMLMFVSAAILCSLSFLYSSSSGSSRCRHLIHCCVQHPVLFYYLLSSLSFFSSLFIIYIYITLCEKKNKLRSGLSNWKWNATFKSISESSTFQLEELRIDE